MNAIPSKQIQKVVCFIWTQTELHLVDSGKKRARVSAKICIMQPPSHSNVCLCWPNCICIWRRLLTAFRFFEFLFICLRVPAKTHLIQLHILHKVSRELLCNTLFTKVDFFDELIWQSQNVHYLATKQNEGVTYSWSYLFIFLPSKQQSTLFVPRSNKVYIRSNWVIHFLHL